MALFTTFTAFEKPTADKLNKLSGENTTYTPVMTAVGGGFALGSTGAVAEGQIWRLGDLVRVHFLFVLGTVGFAAGTGIWEFTFPASFTPVEPKNRPRTAMGVATLEDVSVPVQTSAVVYWEQATARVRMIRTTNDTVVAAAVPFTWAGGDRLVGGFEYRIATPA